MTTNVKYQTLELAVQKLLGMFELSKSRPKSKVHVTV